MTFKQIQFLFSLSQIVKLTISFGVLLGYALQFYIPIDIMWPLLIKKYNLKNNLVTKELLFRCFMVIVTCKYCTFPVKYILFNKNLL